jgi:hypothetical protein
VADEVTEIFNSIQFLLSRTTALGSTQLLTQMNTKNIPESKGLPACKTNNLSAICEPTVLKMCEPQCFKTSWATTAHYRDNFTLFFSTVMQHLLRMYTCEMQYE